MSIFGSNTGIQIPEDVMTELNAGKRPSLLLKVNGYEYQCTPGVMGGKTLASFSSEHRSKSGIGGGDEIHVEVSVADSPRKVEMTPEFQKALKEHEVIEFFDYLSNSLQRYHCDLINSAKTEETKERRINKAIELFKDGKKR